MINEHVLPVNAARIALEAEKCILAVVDIQEKLLPAIYNREQLVSNSRLLLRVAEKLDIPALLSEQYPKGLGRTVQPISELLPTASPIEKLEFNCFGCDNFRTALHKIPGQRTTLLVVGMETHICVLQTVLSALENGYIVHVVADAVGSRTLENHRIGLDRMRDAGAVISSTEMAMYELLRKSGTPEFKELLQYVR